MTWYPIAYFPPQFENTSGAPYSGAVLKAYAAGTSTPIPIATTYAGVTTAASIALNASGYPSYGGNVIIPHVQENYKLALYATQAAADLNSGAIWTCDDVQIQDDTNTPFVEYFDGDGTNATFTLSEDLGTDEKILMVFADRKLPDYVSNGSFSSDTVWTKGSGWTIGAGVATATGAISTDLTQNASSPLIQGMSYTITFTITRSAGGVIPKIGGTSGTERTSSGTYTETIIAGSTQALTFSGNAFTGTVDSVSVKPAYAARREIIRPDEYTLVGNQLTLSEAPPSGTKNVIVFAPSLLLGAANNAAAAAATSEANALSYANAASASATNAASSASSAATILDSFDDRYLGSKSSDPTLDNDGNALIEGALYWNSVSKVMKVYNGATWGAAYVGAGGFLVAANDLSDVSSALAARLNLSAAASGIITSSGLTISSGKVAGRASALTGALEELTMSQLLDFITNVRGSILIRGASGWIALPPGATAGQPLCTNGTGADPSYQAISTGNLNRSIHTSSSTFTTASDITTSTPHEFIYTGGGAGTSATGADGSGGNHTGGGAGGTGIVRVTGLSPSTGYTVTIGAGGTHGNDGGTTSIVIGATTYSAAGGSAAAGAGGGTATNGDINITGGRGVTQTANAAFISPGGASFWGGPGAYGSGASYVGNSTATGTQGILVARWWK